MWCRAGPVFPQLRNLFLLLTRCYLYNFHFCPFFINFSIFFTRWNTCNTLSFWRWVIGYTAIMYSNYTTNQSSVRLQPITSVKRRIVRDKYQYSKLTPFGHSWNHYGPTRIDPGPVSDRIPDQIFDHPGPSLGPSLDSTGAKSGPSLDQLETTYLQTHWSCLAWLWISLRTNSKPAQCQTLGQVCADFRSFFPEHVHWVTCSECVLLVQQLLLPSVVERLCLKAVRFTMLCLSQLSDFLIWEMILVIICWSVTASLMILFF